MLPKIPHSFFGMVVDDSNDWMILVWMEVGSANLEGSGQIADAST